MIFSFQWKSERSQILFYLLYNFLLYFTIFYYITYKIALIDIYFEIHHIYNKYKTYLNRLKPSFFWLRHFLMQQEAGIFIINLFTLFQYILML